MAVQRKPERGGPRAIKSNNKRLFATCNSGWEVYDLNLSSLLNDFTIDTQGNSATELFDSPKSRKITSLLDWLIGTFIGTDGHLKNFVLCFG